MTRAASAFAVALLLALPVCASAVDVKTVLSTLGFPDDTEAKIQGDQFVEVALPTRSDRDLNVGIAFRVRQTPDKLVANVMKEKPLLRADPNMIAYGDFHGDGALGDLAKLKLTDEQASAYAQAKAGDALNLSSDEIAALKAAGGDPNGVDAVVNAEQAIVGFLAVPEGTLVVYTNRTSTDQVAGFAGGAKRSIGRKFMASQLETLCQKTSAASGR